MSDEAVTPVEIDESLFPDQGSLKEAADIWNEGGELASKGQPIGTFQVKIIEASLGRAASSDRLQITYVMEILAGEYQGVEIRKYDGLGTAQQASITQQQLGRLGIDATKVKLEELPSRLLALQGRTVKVQTRMNKGFYNIFFQQLASTAPNVAGSSVAAAGVSKRAF